MRKLWILFIMTIIIGFGAAVKQNNNYIIKCQCDNCTYMNLTTVTYPNESGYALYGQYAMTKNGGDYNYTMNGTDINGWFEYTCCGDDDGGHACTSGRIEVTATGESYTSQQGFLILSLVGVAAIFLAIGLSFSKGKWKVRSLFFMASIFISLIILNAARVMAGGSSIISTMTLSALILGIIIVLFMFLYLMIYYTIEVFHYFKDGRKMKWGISDQ